MPRVGYTSPSQSAISRWSQGFHTLRGVIDPGRHLIRPRVIGVVDVWIDF